MNRSQIWPTNGFLNSKSSNFHFHKNDVTWPLRAKGLFDPLGHLTEHWQENWPCYCWDLGERFVSINRLFPKMDESSTTCDKIVSAWFGVTDGLRTDNGPNLVLGDRDYLERWVPCITTLYVMFCPCIHIGKLTIPLLESFQRLWCFSYNCKLPELKEAKEEDQKKVVFQDVRYRD